MEMIASQTYRNQQRYAELKTLSMIIPHINQNLIVINMELKNKMHSKMLVQVNMESPFLL